MTGSARIRSLLAMAFVLWTVTPALGASANDCALPPARAVQVRALPARAMRIAPRLVVESVNNEGWIVGHWTDMAGRSHVFAMNPFLPALSDVATHGAPQAEGVTLNDTGDVEVR